MNDTARQYLLPSGINSHFDFSGQSFQDYIRYMQEIIQKGRLDLNNDKAAIIIAANSPQESIPTKPEFINQQSGKIYRGILLIHGLYDSTLSLQSLYEYFVSKGFLVRSLLLPGHGTRPGDLLQVSYRDWLKAIQFGIASFTDQVENFYIAGFSTGATLAIQQALYNPLIKGLLLFSPAISIRHKLAFIINQKTQLLTFLGKLIPALQWYHIGENKDYAKYDSFCVNAAYQVYLLTKAITDLLHNKKLSQPIFIAAGEDDETIDSQTTIKFFLNQANPKNRLLYYSNKQHDFSNSTIQLIKSALPEQRILDYSHICIPISPTHPHYGQNGDYQELRPFFKIGRKTYKNDLNKEIYYGAISAANLKNYTLHRLSYNPRFTELLSEIDKFLAVC